MRPLLSSLRKNLPVHPYKINWTETQRSRNPHIIYMEWCTLFFKYEDQTVIVNSKCYRYKIMIIEIISNQSTAAETLKAASHLSHIIFLNSAWERILMSCSRIFMLKTLAFKSCKQFRWRFTQYIKANSSNNFTCVKSGWFFPV